MTLTDKQRKFAENIASGMNITESAIKAGYSEKSAHVTGSRTLKMAKVQECIAEIQDEKVKLLQQRFVGMAEGALQELFNVLTDEDTPPQTKTNTAKILLDYAGFKPIDKQETTLTGELDVSQRADLVEKYLKDDGGGEG